MIRMLVLMLVFVLMSFWQIVFVRQSPRFARRRFIGWGVTVGALSLVNLWKSEGLIHSSAVGITLISLFALLVGVAALLLGYRLPWLPHLSREAKRRGRTLGNPP